MAVVERVETSIARPRYSRARPLGRCWRREDGMWAYEVLRKNTSGAFVLLEKYGMVEAPPPATPPTLLSNESPVVSSGGDANCDDINIDLANTWYFLAELYDTTELLADLVRLVAPIQLIEDVQLREIRETVLENKCWAQPLGYCLIRMRACAKWLLRFGFAQDLLGDMVELDESVLLWLTTGAVIVDEMEHLGSTTAGFCDYFINESADYQVILGAEKTWAEFERHRLIDAFLGLETLFASTTDLLSYPSGLLLLLEKYGSYIAPFVQVMTVALREYQRVISNCPYSRCASD